ncbi:MAG: hypothetical protein ACW986_04655 [Promethearchaeota archaeon]|jgi:hypothetical protein
MNEIVKLTKKKIHSFFIFRDTGTCVYTRNFTDTFENLNIDLVTNFFAALFSFAEEITSEKMEILEMVNVKLLFVSSKDFLEKGTKENFIFVIMADIAENRVYLKNCLFMIMSQFYNVYDDIVDVKDISIVKNKELDSIIDLVVSGNWEIDSYRQYYEDVERFTNDLISENEILGAALLSITGNNIFSSLSRKLITRALKELEIRLHLGDSNIPLTIYVLEDGCKVFTKEIVNKEYLVLHFDGSVPLGMCDITSNKIVNQIGELFKSWG